MYKGGQFACGIFSEQEAQSKRSWILRGHFQKNAQE